MNCQVLCLSAVVLAALWVSDPARSDVYVRAPGARVYVETSGPRRPISVRAPFVRVQVGRPVVEEYVIVEERGERLPPPAPGPVSAITIEQFPRVFRPIAGTHRVVFVHPITLQPVEVTFQVPSRRLQKIRVERQRLTLDFGRREVEIEFHRDGTVSVDYDD
ncbi:MAG: hypothetical protein C4297_06370 [Gemmataceae bacterium]